jgi:hypothetical protein
MSSEITDARWENTHFARERAKNSSFYEESDSESPYGYFQGRRIIGRDMSIQGGVYLGGGKREAIVVDENKEGNELAAVYKKVRDRLSSLEVQGHEVRGQVLNAVYDVVQEVLPFDEARVNHIVEQFKNDQKVALDYFITEKAGVCRHQALLGAYLLERLGRDGVVRGTVSIDRNVIPGRGGHAWIRYTNRAGEVFIVDPAQEYIGRLDDTRQNRWFYERPEDRSRIAAA